MDLLNELKALDQLVVEGNLVEAIERYFHPDFAYIDPHGQKRIGKVNKLAYTWDFLRQINHINGVILNESLVGEKITMSEFIFDFEQKNGEPLRVHEIIKREWQDYRVIREWYFVSEDPTMVREMSGVLQHHREVLEKSVQLAIPFGGAGGLKSEVVCLQKGALENIKVCIDIQHINIHDLDVRLIDPQGGVWGLHHQVPEVSNGQWLQQLWTLDDLPDLKGRPILGTWALEVKDEYGTEGGQLRWWCLELEYSSMDDLTKIEGIGPKIAEILREHEIDSFGRLTTTPVEALRTILGNASNRFKMHDPTSWPEQAALAAAGEWEKLAILQEKLKGGKRL